jgi:hypothetical protein
MGVGQFGSSAARSVIFTARRTPMQNPAVSASTISNFLRAIAAAFPFASQRGYHQQL